MQTLKIDQDSEIVQNLTQIEKYFSDQDSLASHLEVLHNTIYKCLNWIDLNRNNIEHETTLQLIEFLSYFEREKNFMEIFSDYRFKFLININKAYYVGIVQQSNSQIIQDNLQRAIRSLKEAKELLFEGSYAQTMENIKLQFTLIKIYLQLISNLTDAKNFKQGLKTSKKCLDKFSALINVLSFQICENEYQKFKEGKVYEEEIKKNPLLLNTFKQYLKQISETNYYIQNVLNAFAQQNNDFLKKNHDFELIKNSFNKSTHHKLFPSWIEKISVNNFFQVEYIMWEKLNQPIGLEDIFTEIFLSLLIKMSSILYYLIAKNIRNLCIEQYKKVSLLGGNKVKPIFEQNVLQYITKTREHCLSKELHYLGIKILKSYFPLNKIVDFLLKQFKKTFQENKALEEIQEEQEDITQSNFHNIKTTQRSSILELNFGTKKMNLSQSSMEEYEMEKLKKPEIKKIDDSTQQTVNQYTNRELDQTLHQHNIEKLLEQNKQILGDKYTQNRILQNLGLSEQIKRKSVIKRKKLKSPQRDNTKKGPFLGIQKSKKNSVNPKQKIKLKKSQEFFQEFEIPQSGANRIIYQVNNKIQVQTPHSIQVQNIFQKSQKKNNSKKQRVLEKSKNPDLKDLIKRSLQQKKNNPLTKIKIKEQKPIKIKSTIVEQLKKNHSKNSLLFKRISVEKGRNRSDSKKRQFLFDQIIFQFNLRKYFMY